MPRMRLTENDFEQVSPAIEEELQVAFCTDKGYASRVEVAAFSLLRKVQCPVRLVVVCTKDARGCFPRLMASMKQFPMARIDFVAPEPLQAIVATHTHRHLPAAAMGRLMLPLLMKGTVLYLDGDVLVRRDVSELAAFDMSGLPVAAAPDFGFQKHRRLADPANEDRKGHSHAVKIMQGFVGLPLDRDNYINSGAMLINCDKLRADPDLLEQCFEFENARSYPTLDQDLINLVFAGQIAKLPDKWNVAARTRKLVRSGLFYAEEVSAMRAIVRDPHIIHFYGRDKPWHRLRLKHLGQDLGWRLAYRACERDLDRLAA